MNADNRTKRKRRTKNVFLSAHLTLISYILLLICFDPNKTLVDFDDLSFLDKYIVQIFFNRIN
jgi:hypothetical protein